MNPIIQLKNISFTYENAKTPALKDINLSVKKGQLVAIIGINGSGKSTLAQTLNGILPISKGKIVIDGQTLREKTVWDIRKKIGIIFQNPDHQFVGATVEDDVAFGLENQAIPRPEMIKRVHWALEQVNMLSFAQKVPQSLSGGQKQRVAIAGVIAIQPKIIIMDESTSMLDPNGRREILQIMKHLQTTLGITILTITHNMSEIVDADDVVVLQHGEILKQGTVKEIFDQKDYLQKLGLVPPFTQRIQSALIKRNIPIDDTYHTWKGLLDELCQLRSKM